MTQEAIKLELIEWLTRLNNKETIKYLKAIKDQVSAHGDWWDNLTADQKAGIERGLKDIEEGRIVSHADVKERYGF
jgi:predicted transcriptional regulator